MFCLSSGYRLVGPRFDLRIDSNCLAGVYVFRADLSQLICMQCLLYPPGRPRLPSPCSPSLTVLCPLSTGVSNMAGLPARLDLLCTPDDRVSGSGPCWAGLPSPSACLRPDYHPGTGPWRPPLVNCNLGWHSRGKGKKLVGGSLRTSFPASTGPFRASLSFMCFERVP